MTSADRKHLRGLAHALKPLVHVGSAGLTGRVVEAVDMALADHELIKVKMAAERDERKVIAEEMARRTGSEIAGLIGSIAILYRPAAEPEKRSIVLSSV